MNRIGIDIGGTKIDAILLGPAGDVLFERRVATPQGYGGIIAAVGALVAATGDNTASIGIGSPGSASPVTGLWRNANILVCNGKPFTADLQAALGRPVRMENDANCFALSEAQDGAGAGHGIVAFFTVGTALGGGLVIDGKVRSGPNAEAAEFGHLPLPWPDASEWPPLPCFCGKAGCVEQYVSGTGMARNYRTATGRDLAGKDIVARARAGEAEAAAALRRLSRRFGKLVAALVNTLDPDIFVVGGGMSGLPELVEHIPEQAARFSFSRAAQVKVVRAHHGEKSGVRGAARLWPQQLE